MKLPAQKAYLTVIRRKVYHRACGEPLRWVPGLALLDGVALPSMYQCTGCWEGASAGRGFWRYETLEKMTNEEIGARFEIDDEDTVP